MTASVKQLEKKLRSLENANKLLGKTCEKLMGSFGDQKTVKGKSVRNLVEAAHVRFVAMALYIGRAIARCLSEVIEVKYLGAHQRWSWTGCFKGGSGHVVEVQGREYVAPLDYFSLVGVKFCKRSLTTENSVFVKLAKAHFESVESSAVLKTADTDEEVRRKISNCTILKAQTRPLLSNTCSLKRKIARDVLFQQLGYHTQCHRTRCYQIRN